MEPLYQTILSYTEHLMDLRIVCKHFDKSIMELKAIREKKPEQIEETKSQGSSEVEEEAQPQIINTEESTKYYIQAFREALLNSKYGKKNIGDIIQDDSKKQILKLKKGLNIDKKTKQPMVKNCTIFDIPSMIWSSPTFDHFYFMETEKNQGVLRQKISF